MDYLLTSNLNMIQHLTELMRQGIADAIAKEEQFNQHMGGDLVPSTKFQNRNGGFDFILPIKIEYKSAKKIRRSDTDYNYELIWIELRNNYGAPGWLYKQADLFSFELEHHYLMVFADELRKYVESLTLKEDGYRNEFSLVTRRGREDQLTLIKTLRLVSLPNSFLIPKP